MTVEMVLQDKVAIVTGASRGIGRAIALCLAEAGAHVVCTSRTVKKLDYMPGTIGAVAKEVEALGRRALPIQCDVSREEQVQEMVKKTLEEFGQIDILVNNAGIVLAVKPLWDVSVEEWNKILSVDLTGTFLCCKYVIPHMMERQYGKIINMGSIQGRQGLRYQAAYGMCKAGVHNLTLALAKDCSFYNINVNCVGPGAVRSFLMESVLEMELPEDSKDQIFDQLYQNYSLFGREVTPEDIGYMCVYLASDLANNINGQTIFIDGGQPLKGE